MLTERLALLRSPLVWRGRSLPLIRGLNCTDALVLAPFRGKTGGPKSPLPWWYGSHTGSP